MMHTRIPHLQLVIDRTPKRSRRRPIVIAVLLFLAAMTLAPFMIGCGVQHALVINDPGNLMGEATVMAVVDHVLDVAPQADADKVRAKLHEITITISAKPFDSENDLGHDNGHLLSGRNDIHVWYHDCDTIQPGEAVIAHELGHAIGHVGHGYVPWFGGDPGGHTGMEKTIGDWWCEYEWDPGQ